MRRPCQLCGEVDYLDQHHTTRELLCPGCMQSMYDTVIDMDGDPVYDREVDWCPSCGCTLDEYGRCPNVGGCM